MPDDPVPDDPVPDDPTPAQEQEVCRLLAAARHDGTVPPDVAARLDETLDSLVSARASGQEPAVVPLRRRWPAALLAAAAVTAVGFGTAQLVTGGGGESIVSDESGGEAEGRAEDAPAPSDRARDDGSPDPTASADPEPAGPVVDLSVTGLVVLGGAEELDGVLLDEVPPRADPVPSAEPQAGYRRLLRACGPRVPEETRTSLAATYGGRPAVVTVGKGWAGIRPVEIYVCDGPRPRGVARSLLVVDRPVR